jgi:hypothetical protein
MVAGERECEETACLLLLLLTFVSMEIKRRRHVKLICIGGAMVSVCVCVEAIMRGLSLTASYS